MEGLNLKRIFLGAPRVWTIMVWGLGVRFYGNLRMGFEMIG